MSRRVHGLYVLADTGLVPAGQLAGRVEQAIRGGARLIQYRNKQPLSAARDAELALIVLLALLNGFFALSEMALMTSRRSRLKHLARSSRRAQIALKLAQTPERFLATVQVFITLLGIGTGAALGARLGADFARLLDSTRLEWLAPYASALGVALSVTAITFANMLFGELVPKRVALVNPERYAVATAVPMRVLTWLATPFAFVSTKK